jgi:hypothetical protein
MVEFHSITLDILILFQGLRQLNSGMQRHFLVIGPREVDAGVVTVILLSSVCALCCRA